LIPQYKTSLICHARGCCTLVHAIL